MNPSDQKTGASPLRKVRHLRGLTLQEVGRRMNMDSGSISRIEVGGQWPPKDLLVRLTAFYAPDLLEVHILFPERYMSFVAPPLAVKKVIKTVDKSK
jgi:transcriptional regulator with XRE-family HTH domain